MTPLSVEWTMGMSEQEKADFELILRNNTRLFRRIHEILDQWDKETSKAEFTIKDFSEPNWANKQAFRNGDRSRLKRVKDLFTL